SSFTINAGSSCTLNGFNLTLTSFTNAGNFTFQGTEVVNTAPTNLAGSTITYNGTATSPVLSTWTYQNLAINGSGAFNAAGNLTVNGRLSLTAGTLNTTASNYSITVSS